MIKQSQQPIRRFSMKVVGIIAEFNPFHNGHQHLIKEVRRLTGADYVIALMSGDYVQRGVPAITDRQVRTSMALLSGVDAVFSYPVRYATSSAESFASHAIDTFNALNCIDVLAFGSECGNIDRLKEVAEILVDEPEEYRFKLQDGLKEGLSFPMARAQALPQFKEILDGSNNILAIEYLKALMRTNSTIRPVTVSRSGPSHLDDETVSSLSSAAAVRRALTNGTSFPGLTQAIPTDAFNTLREDIGFYGVTSANDYSLLLADRLWKMNDPALLTYFDDVTLDLAQSIMKKRNSFRSFDEFANDLKSKTYTRTHINRALLHIILDIRKRENNPSAIYGHVLGFRKDSEALLKVITDSSSVPIITKTSEADEKLGKASRSVFDEEVRVSNLYETIRSQKSERPFRNVLSKPLVIV